MVDEVSPSEVHERLDDLQVIDIRRERKFENSHIPGAENVPMAELTSELSEREWADEVVVVCPVGKSSVQAARLIEAYEGVDDDAEVASMEDGYEGWSYELESE